MRPSGLDLSEPVRLLAAPGRQAALVFWIDRSARRRASQVLGRSRVGRRFTDREGLVCDPRKGAAEGCGLDGVEGARQVTTTAAGRRQAGGSNLAILDRFDSIHIPPSPHVCTIINHHITAAHHGATGGAGARGGGRGAAPEQRRQCLRAAYGRFQAAVWLQLQWQQQQPGRLDGAAGQWALACV